MRVWGVSTSVCTLEDQCYANAIMALLMKCLGFTVLSSAYFQQFVGVAYQGKDIVFRLIIDYSSLRDFGPYVIGLFLYEYFLKMIPWLVLKLKISYRVIIS